MNAIPTRGLQQNFDENFWMGFWVVLLVGAIALLAAMFALDVFFNLPLFEIVFKSSKALTPKQERNKPAAVAVLVGALSLMILAVLYYVHRQGGLQGVGGDALQTAPYYM